MAGAASLLRVLGPYVVYALYFFALLSWGVNDAMDGREQMLAVSGGAAKLSMSSSGKYSERGPVNYRREHVRPSSDDGPFVGRNPAYSEGDDLGNGSVIMVRSSSGENAFPLDDFFGISMPGKLGYERIKFPVFRHVLSWVFLLFCFSVRSNSAYFCREVMRKYDLSKRDFSSESASMYILFTFFLWLIIIVVIVGQALSPGAAELSMDPARISIEILGFMSFLNFCYGTYQAIQGVMVPIYIRPLIAGMDGAPRAPVLPSILATFVGIAQILGQGSTFWRNLLGL